MLDRRQIMWGTAAAALSTALPAMAAPRDDLYKLFDAFFDEDLSDSPEQATNLGLDIGKHADARSKLSDRSIAAWKRDRAEPAQRIARLKKIDRKALTGEDAINYDTALFNYEAREGTSKFDYGAGARPFVLNQYYGAYISTPSFLDSKHKIENAADADNYIARTKAFATAMTSRSTSGARARS